jgi:glycerol-3-phosphate dehydrogenase
MYDDLKGYVNISGVRSTGLTNSVAVAKYVTDMLIESGMKAEPKTDFIKTRKGTPHFADLSAEEKAALIKEDPRYGNVICRCETITEGQICDAIHRTLGATTLDGVKRRVRAGMGRCQGGFCGPRVIEIIARELGVSPDEVCKNDKGSEMLKGFVR